jgi:hypothetical protein
MLHRSGRDTHASEPARRVLYSEPTDSLVQKVMARIPISCVRDNFSARAVALTKSI